MSILEYTLHKLVQQFVLMVMAVVQQGKMFQEGKCYKIKFLKYTYKEF